MYYIYESAKCMLALTALHNNGCAMGILCKMCHTLYLMCEYLCFSAIYLCVILYLILMFAQCLTYISVDEYMFLCVYMCSCGIIYTHVCTHLSSMTHYVYLWTSYMFLMPS